MSEALQAGAPVRLLMLPRGALTPALAGLKRLAVEAGVTIWEASAGDMRRMSSDSDRPAGVLAMCGPPPTATLDEALGRGGMAWLLHHAAYPSNAGFTIRTAEVAGADAVVIDAPDWNHADRSRASHVSMGADRLLPVLFETTEATVASARARGLRILALEASGTTTPFETTLSGPVLTIVGNERTGIPQQVLAQCDAVLRIPMPGFVPSYNVQAAIAAVAYERLRQQAAARIAHRTGPEPI